MIYPISEPPLTPTTEKITLAAKQGVAQSPFSGHTQVINNFYQWQVELSFPAQLRGSTAARVMMGWLVSLKGMQGSFLYYPANSGKLITGKTLANTGFTDSSAINVAGWSGSADTGLDIGDYFSLGNYLYCITSVPVRASGGQATINFEPPLRADVAAGSSVNFATPRVELRMASSDGGQGYSSDPEFLYFEPMATVQVL